MGNEKKKPVGPAKPTRSPILEYLEGQREISQEALRTYDVSPLKEVDIQIQKMREVEAIKLRDRVYELDRHILVVKTMV